MMKLSINDKHYNEKLLTQEALHLVMDPELYVNIIDLGLVYNIEMEDNFIIITMTFSTPHCPLGEAIKGAITNVMADVFPEKKLEIKVVWDPPWNFTLLTEEGKRQLGL